MKSVIFLAFFSLLLACSSVQKSNEILKKEQIELGKRLFFDNRLSANGTKSCASCHAPEFAFSDGYRRSMGIEADETLRNSPSLLNTSFYKTLTWASPTIRSYEQQMLGPMFKQHPPELGLDSTNLATIAFLQNDIYYKKQFAKVFPKDKQVYDYQHVIKAIANYERTLISFNSPYDAYKKGDKDAISAAAKRGEQLFFSAELQCGKCHPYPLFTDADQENAFHNIGYFSEKDLGVFSVTKLEKDKGKFRTPTLRNINLTSPYMHDGSIEQLENVIKYFEKPLQNTENHSFTISETQRKDLISFLATLTDTSFSIKQY